MPTSPKKAVKSHKDHPVDKKGYVHIRKDGTVSAVRPESVEVWVEDGWTVVDDGTEAENLQQLATGPDPTKKD